jgi:hypothetical protein
MDEIFGYFPPVANPPSKRPLLTLLKQARAFGVGVVLATQNPVDLDYKGLANCGTWMIGRLQAERDKLRVLDGLEGAASSTGQGFDRAAMEARLAGLKGRQFVLNNVHDAGPDLFQTRWALSYLRGPLTRDQLRSLSRDGGEGMAAPATISAPSAVLAATQAAGVGSAAPTPGRARRVAPRGARRHRRDVPGRHRRLPLPRGAADHAVAALQARQDQHRPLAAGVVHRATAGA